MKDKGLSEGYVSLYRKILHNPIFKDREAFQLFMYCLLKANHMPGLVIFNRQKIHVARGQFIFGLEKASADLGMSMWKVRSSLDLLISFGMVTRKTTSRYSIITVCNYNYYQDYQRKSSQARPQTNHNQTTTNNNDNNEDNNKSIECNDFERLQAFLSSLPEYQSFPLEARELILEFINKVRESNRTKTIRAGRVLELITRFKDILDKTDEKSLFVGLKRVFEKMEKDGFDFKKRNPTGYVLSVAKSHKAKKEQDRILMPGLKERQALNGVPEGKIFQELKKIVKGGLTNEEEEEKEGISVSV